MKIEYVNGRHNLGSIMVASGNNVVAKGSTVRDYKISNLRIICIVLVVFAHSIIIYKDGWNYYSTNVNSDFLNYLCQFIYLFHMPLFFSLSGYLSRFSYKKRISFKDFTVKKIRRLVVPFVCIALLYMLPIRYVAQYHGYVQNSFFYNVFFNIFMGRDVGHLWFLPTLLLIFLLHFLAVKYIKNEKIIFAISIMMFACSSFLPSYVGSVFSNFIWFHLGYMINKYSVGYRNRLLKYSSLMIFIGAVLVYFFTLKIKILQVVIQFVAAFTAILFLHSSISDKKPSRVPASIEKNSFGIYLLHSPLIYLTFLLIPDAHPVLMIFINFVILGLFAFGLSYVLRKTKLKFMLGE